MTTESATKSRAVILSKTNSPHAPIATNQTFHPFPRNAKYRGTNPIPTSN